MENKVYSTIFNAFFIAVAVAIWQFCFRWWFGKLYDRSRLKRSEIQLAFFAITCSLLFFMVDDLLIFAPLLLVFSMVFYYEIEYRKFTNQKYGPIYSEYILDRLTASLLTSGMLLTIAPLLALLHHQLTIWPGIIFALLGFTAMLPYPKAQMDQLSALAVD